MKGFKFRLDAILKLKKMHEDKLKMEVGKIQVKIQDNKRQIQEDFRDIEMAYDVQSEELKNGARGENLAFYPYFEQGKKAKIAYFEEQNTLLEKQKEGLLVQLAQARSTVKVYTEMKEKEKEKYKKSISKKKQEILEEQVLSWNYQRKKSC